MEERIKFVCEKCGSENILADAYCEWDKDAQEWKLRSVFPDNLICDDCGSDWCNEKIIE